METEESINFLYLAGMRPIEQQISLCHSFSTGLYECWIFYH